jgi:hypothetical protein
MRPLSRLLYRRPPATPKPSGPRLRLDELEARDVPSATPTVDLTAHGSSGTVNGAIFSQYDARPTGTGVIDSFVRIQGPAKGGPQQGYNTDARPLAYDENKSPQFTRSLKVSDVPTVVIGGVAYKEFLLDINQKASQPLLSLDQLKIFVGSSGNLSGALVNGKLGGLTAVYDLDAGGDNWVQLNSRLNSGSGSGDMLLYVPAALFSGGDYVYLYSAFGQNYSGNGGFEEWSVGVSAGVTPQLSSLSGTVYNAMNGQPIGNWLVYIDTDGNGFFSSGDVYTYTNDNGQYEFANLTAGSYTVRVSTTDIWSVANGVELYDVPLLAGTDVTNLDFYLQMDNPT